MRTCNLHMRNTSRVTRNAIKHRQDNLTSNALCDIQQMTADRVQCNGGLSLWLPEIAAETGQVLQGGVAEWSEGSALLPNANEPVSSDSAV